MKRLDVAIHGASVAALLATMTGCVLQAPPSGEDLHRQAYGDKVITPEAWRAGQSSGAVEDGWLDTFGDERLNALVEEAIANNIDLREAAARVEQAAAAVRIAGGTIYPSVDVLARTSTKDSGGSDPLNIARLTASWELDLWGRVRYGARAAEESYGAASADRTYAQLSVAALVVRSWLLASEAALQRRLAVDTLTGAETLLSLSTDRQRVGIGSDLEVSLSNANVEGFRDLVRQLDLGKEQALRALELLLGRYPAAELQAAEEFPNVRDEVPAAGVPAELLERRPDVVAAERRVAAAFNRTGEARAARLPRITLSAGGTALDSDVLVLKERDDPVWGVGLGLVMPIFAGGALKAQVELRTAEQREAVARYASTGLKAFGEVENALAAERAAADRFGILLAQTRANERALVLENNRYRVGSTDLRSVTQQQLALYSARSALLRMQAERLIQRVNLYLALGGGFEKAPS